MLWTRQALEILYSFKDVESFAKIAPCLMNRVVDRHNRFALFSHFPHGQRTLLSKVFSRMGKAYNFNYWNPNGHYELNLGNEVERDIAVTLFILNKEVFKRIAAGEKADRSQMGNKSCFRNEKYNSKLFIMNNDWQVPRSGAFEFDFLMMIDVPDSKMALPDDQLAKLLEWF